MPAVPQEDAAKLRYWLRHVRCLGEVTLFSHLREKKQRYKIRPVPTAAMLQSQLSVLRAVRFAGPKTHTGAGLALFHVSLTADRLEALRGLPEWGGTLDMADCHFPLAPSEYSRGLHCGRNLGFWPQKEPKSGYF